MSPVEFLEQEYIRHYKGMVKISMLSSIVEAKQMEQSLNESTIANTVCGACDGSKKFMNSDCNICKGTGIKPQTDESCPGINGITDHGYTGQSIVKPSIFLIEKGWIDPLENKNADGYELFSYTLNEQEAKDFCESQGYWTSDDCWSIRYHPNGQMPKYRYKEIQQL